MGIYDMSADDMMECFNDDVMDMISRMDAKRHREVEDMEVEEPEVKELLEKLELMRQNANHEDEELERVCTENEAKGRLEIEQIKNGCEQEYHMLLKMITDAENSIKEFTGNSRFRKERDTLSKLIGEELNNLCDSNEEVVGRIFETLCELLRGETVPLLNGIDRASLAVHPSAITFFFDKFAREIVLFATKPISNENVRRLALLAASVCLLHGDFGNLLLGHLSKRCSFVVPHVDKNVACTNLKEISRIMTFYGHLLASRPLQRSRDGQAYRDYCMNRAKEWFDRILALDAISGVSATALRTFSTVVTKDLISTYGQEYEQSLTFRWSFFVSEIEHVTSRRDQATVFLLKDELVEVLKRRS